MPQDKTKNDAMFKICDKLTDKRVKEEADFNAKLRTPDTVIPDENGIRWGYWRVPGGIICLRQSPRGTWLPQYGRQEYIDDDLKTLSELYALPPIPAEQKE